VSPLPALYIHRKAGCYSIIKWPSRQWETCVLKSPDAVNILSSGTLIRFSKFPSKFQSFGMEPGLRTESHVPKPCSWKQLKTWPQELDNDQFLISEINEKIFYTSLNFYCLNSHYFLHLKGSSSIANVKIQGNMCFCTQQTYRPRTQAILMIIYALFRTRNRSEQYTVISHGIIHHSPILHFLGVSIHF
jgi:hypothetical protein